MPLFKDSRETVRLEHWAPNAEIAVPSGRGLEVFVVEGGFSDGTRKFRRWDWLRMPRAINFQPTSSLPVRKFGSNPIIWRR